jgi:hypothetical protein
VTLWAANAPPPYAAVNLVADAASGQFPVRFWGSEGEVPLGVADGRWKKDWMLIRLAKRRVGP